MQTDAQLPPADKLSEIVHATLAEVKKQTENPIVESEGVKPALEGVGKVEGEGEGEGVKPALKREGEGEDKGKVEGVDELEGEGEVKGVGIKPILKDVDNNAPKKMYDIDGDPGNDTVKHIYNNLGEVNAARLSKESEPLAELKTGGRRRSTRRRHKKSSKKSRRQSKKGGKKHRKRTSKKGGRGKKRSQRKH